MRYRALVVTALLSACGGDAVMQTQGVARPTADAGCPATESNPYGVCYPTSDIGDGIGSRIADFCFGAPSPTCLASLYDPDDEESRKLLVITVTALWSNPSNEQTDFILGSNFTGANMNGVSWANELAPLGVVFGQFIDDGATPGVGATTSVSELASWIADHDITNVYEWTDPGNAGLGVFFDAAAIPLNMYIDLRSMEILAIDVGLDAAMMQTIKHWLKWVASNPPMTPP